jgi:acrylyl-CoA reductase (NADPH)
MCPREERIEAWRRLARDLAFDRLERMIETVPLSSLPDLAQKILKGEIRGRIVVEIAR